MVVHTRRSRAQDLAGEGEGCADGALGRSAVGARAEGLAAVAVRGASDGLAREGVVFEPLDMPPATLVWQHALLSRLANDLRDSVPLFTNDGALIADR